MTAIELPSFNGAIVAITVDAQPALGVLGFSREGCATITTLCFVEPGAECPLIQHELREDEIESLSLNGPKRLTSRIALGSETDRVVCCVDRARRPTRTGRDQDDRFSPGTFWGA